ncbi:MAG: DEAD/DEAH box helicase family protein [Acholeplasmataceae bacterium]|jgi:superfamily II DNA or RNA helicase|nr:DEAD/DEAH box helicase family protein [Acholeplasmataceae bacterium]
MLKKMEFLPTYIKSRNEIYEEFYKPCMENSIRYDRITGYFGSSIFLVINKALKTFIENKGKIRIICSPVLTDNDINAIRAGYLEKTKDNIASSINEILTELEKEYPNSVKLLSKLISLGFLEIKLAVFDNDNAYYRLMHDKAGVFVDSFGNAVAFRGSINETFKGVSEFGNSESFDAFTNWENNKDTERVNIVIDQFEKMWSNDEPQLRTFELPSESLDRIKGYATEEKLNELYEEVENELYPKKKKWYADSGYNSRKVRKHQEKALNNWEKNGRQGILEMSTGSGKTFIALCAIRESIYDKKEVPIILVPSKLLFKQWESEIENSFQNEVIILRAGAGHSIDQTKLMIYSNSEISLKRCILATYSTASKENFIKNVKWGEHIFVVCDEVHNMGAPQVKKLLEVDAGVKLGLSATPERYFDEEGTKKIISFFNGIIEPKYGIADAIKDGVLVEYYYDVFEVGLEINEQEQWNDLTRKINKRIAVSRSKDEKINDSGLEQLLFLRSDIVKKAKQKVHYAEKLLLEKFKPGQKWLVYLDDTGHIKELYNLLQQYPMFRNQVFEYHSNYEGDLPNTLSYFTRNGGILLSINCLDEGVDIPSIDHALILSSSKNPRQYIQRRGRVLRQSVNKLFSFIYDCFVSPNSLIDDDVPNLSIIRGEISRAWEFAENAKNSTIVKNKLKIIMNNNNIDVSEGGFGIDE